MVAIVPRRILLPVTINGDEVPLSGFLVHRELLPVVLQVPHRPLAGDLGALGHHTHRHGAEVLLVEREVLEPHQAVDEGATQIPGGVVHHAALQRPHAEIVQLEDVGAVLVGDDAHIFEVGGAAGREERERDDDEERADGGHGGLLVV